MNYKPDKHILMSYLYGELDETEKSKVDQYFREHPEELKELQGLSHTREIMGSLKDKEVIAPPIFMDDRATRPLWQSTFVRMTASIAASFLIVMIGARLLGTEVSYSNGELRISVGKKQEVTSPSTQNSGLTADAVQGMINASLEKNNITLEGQWSDQQKKIDASISRQMAVNTKKMNEIMTTAAQASQDQVRAFVGSLQDENLRLMKDYLQLSNQEQKKYVEGLLVEFSQYLQAQRTEDLTVFQTRMSNMEQNTNQFKEETEQLLSSILSNASVDKKNNSY